MPIDKTFILKKLEDIQTYIEELEELYSSPREEVVKNYEKLHTAERLLQLIVDTMIDINNHIIKELSLNPADDFQSTFKTLAQSNVISEDLAQKIAPVVGLRNLIVHRYERLDKDLFVDTLKKEQKDFKNFTKEIYEYLKTEE